MNINLTHYAARCSLILQWDELVVHNDHIVIGRAVISKSVKLVLYPSSTDLVYFVILVLDLLPYVELTLAIHFVVLPLARIVEFKVALLEYYEVFSRSCVSLG